VYDLIVIGAGPGGYEAAAHAARIGKRVALVEEGRIGGTCLNVGCIPAKTFLRSSRLYRECGEAEGFGVHVGERRFDARRVVERKDGIVATLTRGVERLLQRSGVEVVNGHGRVLGRDRVAVGGEVLETEHVLLATGSRVAVPPIPGIDAASVLTSDSVFDLAEIPESVVIVGGGYIGLELATYFSEIGSRVAVFEMLPQVASGCDPDVSVRLLQALQRSGVSFHLCCRVVAVEPDGVRFQDQRGAEARYAAARVINASGRTPVVEGLGLEGLGVELNGRGIRVSQEGRTNVSGVWACGDVTGEHMLAHVATREGRVAVNSMFGTRDRSRYAAMPAVIYTHPEVAMVGWTEPELQAAGVPYRKALVPMGVAGRFLIENQTGSGFVKVLAGERRGEILGVHAMGDGSSEFIVAGAALIEAGVSVARAAEVVFPHPTVSEAMREAILQVRREP
jgi:dihydrolipoamide dehydrogenase